MKKQKVLLVRFDKIGDWILFHSLWKNIVQANPQTEFHLLVNPEQFNIAQTWSDQIYTSINCLPKGKLSYKNPKFLFFYFQLLLKRFDWMVQTMVSVNPTVYSIFRLKFPNTQKIEEFLGDKNHYGFENHRAQQHALQVCNMLGLNFPKTPKLAATNKDISSFIPKTSVVIAPGASANFRKWPIHNYQELATKIQQQNPDITIHIIGAIADQIPTEHWPNHTQFHIQKSWQTVREILQHATIVICNDSALYHASVYLQIPTLVISNGNHFQRFIPYPKETPVSLAYCFPSPDFSIPEKQHQLQQETQERSPYNIQNISVNEVYQKFLNLTNL